MVSVKPDPDSAFQRSSGSSRIVESYLTASRAFSERSSWLSPSQTFVEDSRRQASETSVVWAGGRQRFPDNRDASVAPALGENYAATRREYEQRRGGSPVVESGHDPWLVEDDRSPPTLPAIDSDPYRTVTGHHLAAEPGAYRPGAGEAGADGDGLYRPRKLLEDFYRHVERQDRRQHLQQEEAADEVVDDRRLMNETGRWVKAASAYDGSPPVERESSAETTSYFNGRRLTWPFGTSTVSAMRRRQPQQTADQYQYYVDEDVDKVDRSAVVQQSAAAAADTGAAASPISRLIQRYDHNAMTSSASEALPVATSMHHGLSGGRGDWFPMSWQPPVTSAATADSNSSTGENSTSISEHGDGIKTYSCHICSYIG